MLSLFRSVDSLCFDEWMNLMLDELYDALFMLLIKEGSACL